jgi:Icc-related predicted phosphoesterase
LSSNQRLKIFYASDIHGSERAFRKFIKAPTFYGATAVIFGGDLTGKAVVPIVEVAPGRYEAELFGTSYFVDSASAVSELEASIRLGGLYPYRTTPEELQMLNSDPVRLRQVFSRLMIETAERWVTMADERLRAAGIPALMMLGNDDEPEVRQVLAGGDWISDAEGQIVDLEGYQVLSYGFATTTPWKSPRETTEAGMADSIKELAEAIDPGRPVIFNFHNPPFGAGIDLAPRMTDDLQTVTAGGQPDMMPVGSTSVRTAIETLQPILSLHGHIHESRGASKIGRTLVVNPGSAYNEGILQGVLVTLENGRVVRHQFVNG